MVDVPAISVEAPNKVSRTLHASHHRIIFQPNPRNCSSRVKTALLFNSRVKPCYYSSACQNRGLLTDDVANPERQKLFLIRWPMIYSMYL
ncbi:hypothetical protein CUMW_126970 [Citrus unshiu]|uniref:Uncharacterized protein n=1 Tax=Citrus unshiu TaxID=55188 RepID=A0A2H5PDP9_CITUN|nr:hypothetical protein CUMW_126970 [Citrus unshiu]